MEYSGFDPKLLERIRFNYKLNVVVLDEKQTLGSKENQQCRFCGRRKPEVTFGSDAHAISELLGNKFLLVNYECDKCNRDIFAKYETHLGDFTHFYRATTQQKGKKGYPKLKYKSGFSLKTNSGRGVQIIDQIGNNHVKIDENKKELTIYAKQSTYIPIAVYKSLVKMAISVLPEEEDKYFSRTKKWLLTLDNNALYWPGALPLFYWFIPNRGFKKLCYFTAIRKTLYSQVPYYLFGIGSGNFMYQIYVPFCTKDEHLMGKENMLFPIPAPHIFMKDFRGREEIQMRIYEMNSFRPVKDNYVGITFSFDEIVPVEKGDSLLKGILNTME
jgi:hypothetical protein